MATTLTDLRTSLNRRLSGLSKYISNEILGTGDGSKTVFYVKMPPLTSTGLTVYIDGTANTDYTLDGDYGRITFDSAVANGSVASASYKGLTFHSNDLDDIITEAVEDLYKNYNERSFTISGSNVSPEPNTIEKRLIIQQCVVNLLDNLTLQLTLDAIRTSQTGFSFDTTARAEMMKKLRDKLSDELDYAINQQNMSAIHSNTPEDLIY